MLTPDSYVAPARQVDAVIHTAQLAGPGRVTNAAAARTFAADALMTGALADVCTSAGTRLVYTGGCFDWGDHGDLWVDEQTELHPSPMGVGHAAMAAELARRHLADGRDYVRVVPVFVYGPGGLFDSAFVQQARRGRLRVIGGGQNWWSCVQVDDLGRAYAAALTRGVAGRSYAATDGQPLTLRELVDLTTAAMGIKRVGTIPPALLGLIIGAPLAKSLATNFRVNGARIREELGWTPRYPTFAAGVGDAVTRLAATS